MIDLKLEVKFNHFDTYPKKVNAELSKLVRRTALAIEGGCKIKSRVDKGQMRAGWQTKMEGDLTGVVFNPIGHTIYNELGTRRMSAKPMLVPSVEEQRRPFEDGVRQILNSTP